jgi:uncharacterized phage protein gp47/JayE
VYEAQTEEVIRHRMLNRITNIIDKLEGSFTYDAIAPVTVELSMLYTELDRILTLVFAQTSSGDYLERRAYEFGITRKEGTKSTGIVLFSGSDGVTIPAGTQVQTAGGLVFSTLASALISERAVDVNVQSAQVGTAYNVPAAAISLLPVQIVGVTSVTNANPTTGGSDIETDEGLLARLQVKVQLPSTSGNVNDYKLWALSIAGVGDAKVIPLWNGNGTVKVILIGSDKKPAATSLVQTVIDYIETIRPVGATVTCEAAQALNINISVSVTRDAGYSSDQVIANITSKISNYLKSVAFKTTYVSNAQIGNAIIDSAGVLDYTNLTVNSGTSNISVGPVQVAVLGTVTVNG